MKASRLRCQAGFSMIELISVLLILGIMAALAAPSFNTGGFAVATAAQTIETDLRMVQEIAMTRNPTGSIGIDFTASPNSYTITDPSNMFSETRALPDGVTIASGSNITFNKYGEPVIATASVDIQIAEGSLVKIITVAQHTGQVTITDSP